MKLNNLVRLVFLGICLQASAFIHAEEYPTQNIRLIVPFSPGGSADLVSRLISGKLSESLGRQVIVDNRPGGNTLVGITIAAKAPSDGHTLVVATSSFASNPSVRRKMPYDTEADFAPVILLGTTPNLIAVTPSLPAKSLNQLIDLARAKSGQLNFATASTGAIHHFTGEWLNQLAKVKMMQVGYKGGGPAMIDVMAGYVPIYIGGLPPTLPHLKSGRLRALAVTSLQRSPLVPKIPTVAESGYPGFNSILWYGVLAPTGTPDAVISKLNKVIDQLLKSNHDQLLSWGVSPVGGSSEELRLFIKEDIERWSGLVKNSGIKLID